MWCFDVACGRLKAGLSLIWVKDGLGVGLSLERALGVLSEYDQGILRPGLAAFLCPASSARPCSLVVSPETAPEGYV